MFLVSDIIQAPMHRYIVVSVDDSNPDNIVYSCIRDTESNRKAVHDGVVPRQRLYTFSDKRIYQLRQEVLEYVESI